MAKHLREGFNIRINRYMNLEKFEKLLSEECLWFNKLNNFDDLHEGRALVEWENNSIEIIDSWRDRFVVNCWNWDDDENFALWNIYLGGSTAGVCLISTRNDVLESMIEKEGVESYFVKYEKYGQILDEYQSRDIASTKYDWYSYENEFRFLKYIKEENLDKGIRVKIQPSKLIKGIILSPNMDKSNQDKVYDLCKQHDISIKVIKKSIISDKTFLR